jgi:phenylpropionate dioxygenase-like ring-hydroxylating dioxygenase large terminal subunit
VDVRARRLAHHRSALGTGARFRFQWPLARAAPARDPGDADLRQADADAPPLAEVAAGTDSLAEDGIDLDTLVFDCRLDFDLAANWKVVIENYVECYHCPTAHVDFSKAVDVNPDRYELKTATWSSSQHARARNGDGSCQFHFLWPNTRINVFPGSPNLSIGPALPDGPERTTGYHDYFLGRRSRTRKRRS